ncbi:hypothetical protein, partial [Enterobacter hormaechei]|uniref:hypothetical protein n=1 Tax=Enterobacter hormaechei TaxID=158836 RepID=UPI00092EDCB7
VRFQTKSAGMHPASWLRHPLGDAGAMMLDAYRQILSETEPAARAVMLEFLESVRIHYVSS